MGGIPVGQVVGQDRGGERDQGHRHQQQEVEKGELAVHPRDQVHHRVVVHPDDPDDEEADRVGGVVRPEVAEAAPEVVRGPRLGRRTDVQHEQRDRDREDAIAERLEAGGGHAVGFRRTGAQAFSVFATILRSAANAARSS